MKSGYIFLLSLIALVTGWILMFSPYLIGNDSTSYFIIAKNMVLDGHWLWLRDNYGPWLDKPHLPFWLTALAFKLFGFHPWSYLLPGAIFYLLGAIYTYKLALLLYRNQETAQLSFLLYATTIALMSCALDLRAEAYLLGEILPAGYYLFKYHQKTRLRYLLLGALFAGLALMTKGLFTLITISTGLIALFIYQKQYHNLISIKWWAVVVLAFVVATPEFIALYTQFGVAGIKWFFGGSQFGRFFGTGRIIQPKGGSLYYFVGVFLWAFLPWTLVFIAAVIASYKRFKNYALEQKQAAIYLLSTFGITFLLFSISHFQLDYYINIILPFAGIFSAAYLQEKMEQDSQSPIFKIQLGIAVLILMLCLVLIGLATIRGNPYFSLLGILPVLLLLFMLLTKSKLKLAQKAITYSALAVSTVFFVGIAIEVIVLSQLNSGYIMAGIINQQDDKLPVYELHQSSVSVYIKKPAIIVNNIKELPGNSSYYLIAEDSEAKISAVLQRFPQAKIIVGREFLYINNFLSYFIWSEARIQAKESYTALYKIN